jgi:hypothetical protein
VAQRATGLAPWTRPVLGVTRTSIIVSERDDEPSAALGRLSTPRTSTSSDSSATFGVPLGTGLFAGSGVGALLRDATRPSAVSKAGTRAFSIDGGVDSSASSGAALGSRTSPALAAG